MRYLGVLWTIVIAGALVGTFGGSAHGEYAADTPARDHAPVEKRRGGGKAARERGPVLIAVGDIADCNGGGDMGTAALVRGMNGTLATLGDHVYDSGSKQEFADCYDPAWRSEKARTRPAAGNHEYETSGARGYFAYFGNAAGDRDKGYYSYDLGAWHVIVLNSNCQEVGGCEADSPQGRWLRADLDAHPATCTLAYWHHPLFSSGREHGGEVAMQPAWQTLYDAGADVVLSGHEHNYERFALQDPTGNLDQRRGIQQFVVGTGGAGHYGFGQPMKTSDARNAETYGVLVLTLHPESYDWEFVPVTSRSRETRGKSFTDAGSMDCR